jgi:GMP synthase (glutamine-hydrolysing)
MISGGNIMEIQEIKTESLDAKTFIQEKTDEIADIVDKGSAINALSGGVDSSVVTILGHKALGNRLITFFVDNGIMRQGEPERVVSLFRDLGVPVEVFDAKEQFFNALKGIIDPEEKREAITRVFYKEIFGELVKKSGAKYLLQGTNYTDVEETVAGIKRQHNILEQLGINTQKQYGYKVIEPLVQLRKSGVREVARALGLPEEIYNRPPFPGPALAARVIGEITPEKIEVVKEATKIVEEELSHTKAFQYLAILHQDKVTGIKEGKRDYGMQIEIRCWESKDAKVGSPTRLPYDLLEKLAESITGKIPGVVSVTYNITRKPPSTIEAI